MGVTLSNGFRFAVFALVALLLFVGGCDKTTRDTDIKIIRLSELRSLVDRQRAGERELIAILDPRPERAFAAQHIPGAENLRLPQVDPKREPDPGLARHRHIIVYGDDPASAAARGMTKRLLAVGYDGVRLYAGGIKEWLSRGYDVEGTGLVDAPATPGATSDEKPETKPVVKPDPKPDTKPEAKPN